MNETRIAVVTGASRGIGRSTARLLAGEGVAVIGTYRQRKDEADSLLRELKDTGVPAAVLPLDLRDFDGFAAFATRVEDTLAGFGAQRFHYLVQNAGTAIHAPYEKTTQNQFDEVMGVNVKAPFFLTQALLPLIADGGRVLNVSSGLASTTNPGFAAYATAKGAIEVLTRYQARELGARQIRVNVIVPGATATDFAGGVVRDNPQVRQVIAESTALGRVGEADDVGAAITAILSDRFGWVNGSRIEATGGEYL